MEKKEDLKHLRHSLAHLLAAAVMELWPQTLRAIGPAIDNGFYYDFEFKKPISENDLEKIEEKMREIYPSWSTFNKIELSKKEALAEYKDNPYKKELIEEFSKEGDKLSFYQSGDYEDLCKGGHIKNMRSVDMSAFKLSRIAGAYWRGDKKNTMLTRIYGLAFHSKEGLDEHIAMQEEAKKRDHRKLGKELDLFVFSNLVGPGLPLFTPRGYILRNAIVEYSRVLNEKIGYQEVYTPNINKAELFKISGHYDKYEEDMLKVSSHYTNEDYYMKPMNCPQHTQIYASKMRSYRDLPIRYSDFANLYRDERPGELLGLVRLRYFAQDDGHCFCTEDQIEQELDSILKVIQEAMEVYGMDYWMRLGLKDAEKKEKYLGDDSIWEHSQSIMQHTLEKNNITFRSEEGEAAFYGPKIDVMVLDSLGREWQMSTIQLDFSMPKRFNLTYTDKDGSEKTPIMIHRALIGSPDRFLGVLIEHFGGEFPLWLSPVHIKILPISEKHQKYAQEVFGKLKEAQLRVELDDSDETLGKKIRFAKLEKVPYFLVIGDEEIKDKTVTLENRYGKPSESISLEELLTKLKKEIEAKK